MRPFWPGGDYEHDDYDGKVVVDNPPFSIMTKIVNFYIENNVKFFLFCSGLTIFSTAISNFGKFTAIPVQATLTYENGAKVATSFMTNLFNDDTIVYFDPKFKKDLETANTKATWDLVNHTPHYEYPANVVRVTDIVRAGRATNDPIVISADNAVNIKRLDSQRASKKGIFGSGLLVDDKTADKINKLKQLPAIPKPDTKDTITWTLSDRERKIIDKLNQN